MGWSFYEVGEAPFADVVKLMEFWHEYPPVFMLVRGFVGFKPDKASSRSRRRTVEPSDKMERAAFVKQWGGEIRHTDSLPLAVQGALAEAFKRDGLGELHGKRR